jgi:hypothetical protein
MAWVEDVGVFTPKKDLAGVKPFFGINTPTSSTLAILPTYPPVKMKQSVPKRRHVKFRRRGITQKKAYNIRKTAKV